jgi:hypothetical protein
MHKLPYAGATALRYTAPELLLGKALPGLQDPAQDKLDVYRCLVVSFFPFLQGSAGQCSMRGCVPGFLSV